MNADGPDLLAKPLDAARIKTRAAGGNKPALSYLETHDVIRTANEIFGFGGWGHEIVDLRLIPGVTVTNAAGDKNGVCVGYVCTVRLTVAGCVPTSGVGYGDATEYRESATVTAHELAAKEAESDALKRALKNFGDQFGLALYAKDAATAGHVTRESVEGAGAAVDGARSAQATSPTEFRFASGKFEGKTLEEAGKNYCDWYLEKGPREDVKEAIRQHFGEPVLVGGGGDEDIPFEASIDGIGG